VGRSASMGPSPSMVSDLGDSVSDAPQRTEAEYAASISICRGLDGHTGTIDPHGRGSNWYHGTIATTLYTHALHINDRSCINGFSTLLGIVTASSQHARGANVLYADGHVVFTSEALALETWRSLGTRAGGEVP
jgi:prepilin-type processing-associated H-X9-DG protein